MKEKLTQIYQARFGTAPVAVSRAPGRIEVIGNHTDYNQGTVLSAAVNRYMHIAIGPSQDGQCHLWDEAIREERCFSIDTLEPRRKGDWANYIKGMIVELRKKAIAIPAFNAVLLGTVPLSAGMSSSAALEMATGLALCRLAGVELPWLEMAKAGQACENNTIGAQTGLLDQFSSLRGKANHLVYSDFRTLETSTVPMPEGFSFVIVNCMVKHHLTNEYNDRRASCEDAVATLQKLNPAIQALRDVSPELLEAQKSLLAPESYRCAAHVVGEIDRVRRVSEALAANDVQTFGQLLYLSHESSRTLFNNSCKELDAIIERAKQYPQCLGARLSGGGFGGITIHLVKTSDAETYAKEICKAITKESNVIPQVIVCNTADGASIL